MNSGTGFCVVDSEWWAGFKTALVIAVTRTWEELKVLPELVEVKEWVG
jgi:hypothetical protein